jgi:uncharacterized protein
MKFLNRTMEKRRLDRLLEGGGLGVLWGRRRIGKTRLLLEWCQRNGGLYAVADMSAPAIQRKYLAEAIGQRLAGFGEVDYPDWRTLLDRLAQDSRAAGWRGPLVFDELPYWISSSPELPSILQRWIDHGAKQAGLVVVLAGSSQRMMQGLALDASSPLYGRAREAMNLPPLGAGYIRQALKLGHASAGVAAFAMWGGVPRYWELAEPFGADLEAGLDANMLDPSGPLHVEPDRLLLEELPTAQSLRPVLDAVGLGAHRLTEVAGRIGCPPTGLGRSLQRLQEMGLLERQVPFGENERSGKRALYKIADPFFRAWFRLVASHRAMLAAATPTQRKSLWKKHGPGLVAETWENLCRQAVPRLRAEGASDEWLPARRYWHGNGPEWDLVARSASGDKVLLGEVKWGVGNRAPHAVQEAIASLSSKGLAPLRELAGAEIVRAVFVPDAKPGREQGVWVYNAEDVMAATHDGE